VDSLAQAYRSYPLLFWLLGSVLAYGLVANIFWLVRTSRAWRSAYARLLVQILRFLYFLGVPYLALGGWPRRPLQGLLSLQDLGFVGLSLDWPVTRWLGAVGLGLSTAVGALSILFLAWNSARRGSAGQGWRFPEKPWWALLVDGLYLEVHWAFYRSALAILLGDLYVGMFLGLALVYIEWSASPFWRRSWRSGPAAVRQWWYAALALVSALVFLFTRNLWVCLGVHWLMTLPFWHVARVRPAAADAQSSPRPSPQPEA